MLTRVVSLRVVEEVEEEDMAQISTPFLCFPFLFSFSPFPSFFPPHGMIVIEHLLHTNIVPKRK